MKKAILFGGTFDPVHTGHVTVAQYSAKALCADEVVFIPAKRSPHKKLFPIADGNQRVEMIKLAITDTKKFRVSDWELKRDDPSYSVDTIKNFREEYGEGWELFWLMGADAIKDLPRWHCVDELLEMCSVCVMYRGGYEVPDFSPIAGEIGSEAVRKLDSNVIKCPRIDVSSSDIRQMLSAGQEPGGAISPSVRAYIMEKGLYLQEMPR